MYKSRKYEQEPCLRSKLEKKLVFFRFFFIYIVVVVVDRGGKIDSLVVLARLAQSGKTDHQTHLCSISFPRSHASHFFLSFLLQNDLGGHPTEVQSYFQLKTAKTLLVTQLE